jgi:oxygen-independent coproporphyrinogen-3 oxidase
LPAASVSESINLDLIYGLPSQDETTLRDTLDAVIELQPDRLAGYSFAFVPWIRPHQRRIDEALLPGTRSNFALLARVVSSLTNAGHPTAVSRRWDQPSGRRAPALVIQ